MDDVYIGLLKIIIGEWDRAGSAGVDAVLRKNLEGEIFVKLKWGWMRLFVRNPETGGYEKGDPIKIPAAALPGDTEEHDTRAYGDSPDSTTSKWRRHITEHDTRAYGDLPDHLREYLEEMEDMEALEDANGEHKGEAHYYYDVKYMRDTDEPEKCEACFDAGHDPNEDLYYEIDQLNAAYSSLERDVASFKNAVIGRLASLATQFSANKKSTIDLAQQISDTLASYEELSGWVHKMQDRVDEVTTKTSAGGQSSSKTPKRYAGVATCIIGTCPTCGNPDAYVGLCEICRSSPSENELNNPRRV